MAVKFHQEDILPHIGGANTLGGRTAVNESCTSLLDVIKVCVKFNGNSAIVTVYLLGIDIGSATITPDRTCVTIGGGAAGYKAEVEICLNYETLILKICGKVCFGIFGCKEGCTSIHL